MNLLHVGWRDRTAARNLVRGVPDWVNEGYSQNHPSAKLPGGSQSRN